jgi:hypothetical protein
MANRPDIILTKKQEKTCIPIDVPIPVDRNVMQERAEKKIIQGLMNRDVLNLEHEMQHHTRNNWSHWNNNRFKEKFEDMPGKYSIDTLEKVVALGISQKMSKVLKSET